MKLFIDTNILADMLFSRQICLDEESEIFKMAYKGQLEISVSALSIVTSLYISKSYGKSVNSTKLAILNLCKVVKVEDLRGNDVVDLLYGNWKDYEDSTQHQTALNVGADCIITRDKKHFSQSELPVFTPTEFVGRLAAEN